MTHKLLTAVCALALVLSFSFSASAAVQNVKVGGDIEVKGIWQSDYDITASGDDVRVQDYLMTTTRLYVEASLTDNVSAMVRLLNDRDWDGIGAGAGSNDVEIDLAYLTLSDMYGYPCSLTIGRQELLYGEGFLVGDGVRDTGDSYQYGVRKAFDAIKAVWDYEPHQIDLFVAKLTEGSNDETTPVNTDEDLYGINWNYDGGMYGLWDLGLFYDITNSAVKTTEGLNDVWALSIRGEGSLPQIDVGTLALKGELVKEWGNIDSNLSETGDVEKLDAWAGYLEAEYTFDNVYAPYLGLGYIYMSGDDINTEKIEQFNPLFEDERYGEIIDWVYDAAFGGMTNAQIWKLSTGFNPTENTALDLTYYSYTADQKMIDEQKLDIGSEYDVTFSYNYSEDVTFGLLCGVFYPGDFFKGADDDVDLKDNATTLIGSVKVTF